MKPILILLLICITSSILFAQLHFELSGQVKDAQTKKALEFCSVAVFNTKDSLITGTVTDEKGFFIIPLKRGNYHLVFRFIGYKSDTTKSTDVTGNKFLGVFKLESDVKELKEVSVKVSSKENQLDRDVQIVTDKMKSGAANTKDVLDKISGVTYDRFSNSIKVDNNDKVIILVDGMEKDQDYIKNLSPERLKKIEVIRDPGGRYALEGYSAVINVILKKDYQGTEITIGERAMTDLDAVKDEYIPVQNNTNASVNYVYNNINLYTNISNNINNFNLQSTNKKEYENGLVIEKKYSDDKDMNTKVHQLFNNYTLGADYNINPKHTVSFEGNINSQPSSFNNTSEIFNISYFKNGINTDNYYSESKNNSDNFSSYNAFFYEGKFDENNILKTNFTYSFYNNCYLNSYNENLNFNRTEDGKDIKNGTKFYAEFTHTFQNKTSLHAGYGNTWEKRNNNFTADLIESNFIYSDFRHKLYAYYSWQKSKIFSVKFGGAVETSAPNAAGQKNSYLIFQPYADIKYKPSDMFDCKLKYRSSGNYPDISQTNPFTSMADMQSIRTGNPELQPEVTHRISLQNNILKGLVTIEPYYHFSNNLITEIGTLRSDSIFQYGYKNAGQYLKYGVDVRFMIPFGESLFLKSDFNIFQNSISFDGNLNEFVDWSMSNQLIYQNQKYKTVVGLQYQRFLIKYITAQGYSKGDNDYWIMFVQQPFFKEKLDVMLLYFFPINWAVNYDQGSYIKTKTYKEIRTNDISLLKNMILLQINYRFNKGKTVNKTEKNIEKDKEKSSKGLF